VPVVVEALQTRGDSDVVREVNEVVTQLEAAVDSNKAAYSLKSLTEKSKPSTPREAGSPI